MVARVPASVARMSEAISGAFPSNIITHTATLMRTTRYCSILTAMLLMQAQAQLGSLGCQREMIAMGVSPPDDKWVAIVQEEVCTGIGIASTGVTDVVQLLLRESKSENGEDVFAIEEHGDPTNRPNIKWLSPTKLQITVPNTALIGLDKKSHAGIEIAIKYEPDDPAERERYLKQFGLTPR